MGPPPESGSGLARTDREILIELRRDVRYVKETMERETRATTKLVADHEGRIRVLEGFRWWLFGGIAFSGAIGAFVAKVIR